MTFSRCTGIASEIVWCPTWINIDGTIPQCVTEQWAIIRRSPLQWSTRKPLWLCAECAKTFKPEFNPHCKGEFYWGENALAEYEKRQLDNAK